MLFYGIISLTRMVTLTMISSFEQPAFSPFADLYDILIPQDNFWRKLHDIDFSFIIDSLQDQYTLSYGRKAVDPIRLFKMILLKNHHKLSDRDLVHKCRVDMEMKFFLDYAPEETSLIDPSLLSKFRTMRLADTNVLDLLIAKTVEIALEKGVIASKNKLIVDATHTTARFQPVSIREELLNRCRDLRKSVYAHDQTMHDKMPLKRKTSSGIVEDVLEYCQEVVDVIESEKKYDALPNVQERMNYLKEAMEETQTELQYSKDQDAKVGHKSADSSFFGYKTHIAMTPERIVTAAKVTSGEKHDGKQLDELVEKSRENGIEVEAVIGDGAYSEKENLKKAGEEGYRLAAKLSASVRHGNRKNEDQFEYNKDAGMYVCKAGHMATRKARGGQKKAKSGSNTQHETYYFDVEKCKRCPLKEGCYKGTATKTYSVKIKDPIHTEQMDFMETDEYKELTKERYKIEAKNAELKERYGYGRSNGSGIESMKIQGAAAIFMSNMKRILKLEEEKIGGVRQKSEKEPS